MPIPLPPGTKRLTIGCGTAIDTVTVYVAESDGVTSALLNDGKNLYYTENAGVNVFSLGDNILPTSYYGKSVSKSNNSMTGKHDGSIYVDTDGTLTESFPLTLYRGAPLIPACENSKIRISFGKGDGCFLKFNLWEDYENAVKAREIKVHSGECIDVDLSQYSNVTSWEIVMCVSAYQSVELSVYPKFELIDEITNGGVEYELTDFVYTAPVSSFVSINTNGLVIVYHQGLEDAYIYAAYPGQKIYIIE